MRIATVLAVALLGTASLAGTEHAQAAIRHYQLNIPRQSLDTALKDLAQQTGLQIGRFSGRIDGSAAVGPVRGDQTLEQALKSLLNDTGLDYKIVSDTTIAVYNPKDLTFPTTGVTGSDSPLQGPAQGQGVRDKKDDDFSADRLQLAQAAQGPTSSSLPGRGVEGAEDSSSKYKLEEIIVTASKRSEALSQVGSAVSAISGRDLDEMGANSLEDYLSRVPGVALQSNGVPGFGEVSIRGIAAQSVGATTATYIDNVPFGVASALTQSAYFTLDMNPTNLERVEVLKGPQGTLYGASSMGGLIKYVTRAPDLTAFNARTQEDINQSYNGSLGMKASGTVSMPLIVDTLAVSMNGYYLHDGGYITDLGIGGEDTNRSNSSGFTGALLYKPSDRLSIRLNAIAQEMGAHGANTVDVNDATGRPVYGALTQFRYLSEPFSNQMRLYSAELNYHWEAVELLSATSYSSLRPTIDEDLTDIFRGFGIPFASPQTPLGDDFSYPSHMETEELRLTSQRMGSVEWIAGAFFRHESESDYAAITQFLRPGFVPGINAQTQFRQGTLSEYAEYADLTWYLTPRFDVTAGMRHSNISQTSFRGSDGVLGNPTDPTVFTTSYQAFSEAPNTYLVNARWRVSDDVMLYARAASGYRPGGGRTVPPGAPAGYLDYYTADSLWDYEAGVKLRKLGGRLVFDADTFWINWTNIQAVAPVPGTFLINDGNAGKAVSRGAEFDVAYIPVAGLTVGANGAYTDAKFTQAVAAIGIYNGEPLFYVPKYTATVYCDFERPIGSGWDGFMGGNYAYQSQRLDLNRTPMAAYSIWDLRLGVHNSTLRVNVYVKNLTNKIAYQGYVTGYYGGASDGLAVNQPRTFGLTFSQSF